MTEKSMVCAQPFRAGHTSAVSQGTRSSDADTSRAEVAIGTLLGALAMEPTGEKAEPNLLNLLIVDDERSIREGCREVAQSIGYATYVADNAEHAFRVLDTVSVDVVLLDLRLPGVGGLEILKEVKRRRPETVVVVMTGYASVQSAVQAMKQGAFDYVTKPFNLDELRLILDRVLGHLQLSSENRILRQQVKSKEGFGTIIGRSPEMEKLYRIISKAAHSSHPVLILGESGTGKELVARSIHFSGPYRDKPFVAVDCGSLVPTLIESELFGYTKGAFTGAAKNKDGLLQAADGGTIFLDEIGELPVDLQSKLLRALQEREFTRVGGSEVLARALQRGPRLLGHEVTLVGMRPAWSRPGSERDATLLAVRFGRVGAALDGLLPTSLVREEDLRRVLAGAEVVHSIAREWAGALERTARALGAAFVETPLVHPGQPFSGAGRGDVARYRRDDAVLALTECEAAWYRGRGAANVHATGLGPNLMPLPRVDRDEATILFVGRKERYKGYHALRDAAPLVWRERPDARFVAIGQNAWNARLRRWPQDARWIERGVVDETEKAESYARATIFAMPSEHETFGLTYLEAWAAGLPVIAGDIAPLREVVREGIDGLHVRNEPSAIADAILALLRDPAAARRMTVFMWSSV